MKCPSSSKTARSSAGSSSSAWPRAEVLYGQPGLSNYQGQGLKLSKHFVGA